MQNISLIAYQVMRGKPPSFSLPKLCLSTKIDIISKRAKDHYYLLFSQPLDILTWSSASVTHTQFSIDIIEL